MDNNNVFSILFTFVEENCKLQRIEFVEDDWTFITSVGLKLQENSVDCGVFMLLNAYAIASQRIDLMYFDYDLLALLDYAPMFVSMRC